jgi:hypothetical protein
MTNELGFERDLSEKVAIALSTGFRVTSRVLVMAQDGGCFARRLAVKSGSRTVRGCAVRRL